MPDRRITDTERAAALHWQAPEQEPLGDWLLRAAEGFTGRANSALPLGDPGVPLPAAVEAVEDWYRRRALPPTIVLPGPLQTCSRPDPLEDLLAERGWVPRPGPAFVMTADIADIAACSAESQAGSLAGSPAGSPAEVRLVPEPDASFLGLYRYRGQDLPPVARTLLMSAPWQAFGSVHRDGRAVAVGRVSVAGPPGERWGALTAVEVDPAHRRQGLGVAITSALAAAAADRGARRVLLQVETGNAPARALYARCGFRDSHRYHYMLAP
ncbi:MAG: GNAT family N-acetyltransferase [Streptosporangiaceae bacterium]